MKSETFELGCYYHIYNRGNNSENIFIEEKNYFYFLQLLKKYILPVADIYCYCLLKNHFHIVLKIKDKLPGNFESKIYLPFSNFFNSYTKSINKSYQRNGSLFQEHLKRIKVSDENYLKQLIIYVHLNPVKHQFTEDFKSYKNSSFLAYLSNSKTDLERNFILELFGGKENFLFSHVERQIKYEGVIEEIDKMDW